MQNTQGLIFVVDSNDRERIGEAQEELQKMVSRTCCLISPLLILIFQLQEDELREATLLVFANKQDLPNAMTASELTDKLGLQSLRNRKVRHIISGSYFIQEHTCVFCPSSDFKLCNHTHLFQWYIQATCAVQGHGLYEGLDWLSNELSKL